MKNLSFLDKVIFFVNSIFAFLLLASFVIPYIPPKVTSTIAVLSLGMHVLMIINTLFIIYWILKIKKQFILSLLILAIGYQHVNAYIQFGKKESTTDTIKVMSYNVHMFRPYNWTKKNDLDKDIYEFINHESPDIIAFQEHPPKRLFDHYKKTKHEVTYKLNAYKYKYLPPTGKQLGIGHAIYSKHKIINDGSFDFVNSGNNAIFADIVIQKDTVRIYNIHLQSFKINKDKDNFGQKDAEKLLKKFKRTFIKQENQVNKIMLHASKSPYKTIFMGDFNNNAFSWAYKQLSKNKNDAFIEAGKGFGKSFDYFFPIRIDFILTDPIFSIKQFETFNDVMYSDHFPIMARININK